MTGAAGMAAATPGSTRWPSRCVGETFATGSLRTDDRASRRGERGHELLHLRSPLATSRLEHGPVIVECQVRSQEPHGREVDRARREQLEDHRETARCPSDLDAVVGFVLGEREDVAAVGEEGAVAGSQMDIACVELGEVSDEQGRGAALPCGQVFRARDEFLVGERPKGGESVVPHAFLYHPRVQARVRNRIVPRDSGRPTAARASPRKTAEGLPFLDTTTIQVKAIVAEVLS